jgi:carboxymethylenebutenolidase
VRDDDRMLDLPDPEFGSGVIGICDICGERQAVIVLSKERYKLCVIDFLNKAWVTSDKKPGAPAPAYRSERVAFESVSTPGGSAPAIVLSSTKPVKRPAILVTPDVYGLTTTLLDAAIRFAREGFEVMVPDVGKTGHIGASHHVTLRSGVRFRGGVPMGSKRVRDLVNLYQDAFEYLRGRELVDPAKSGVFGASYGASLALALAARETRLTTAVLAYPMPVQPADLANLVSIPVLYVGGTADRASARARSALEASRTSGRTPVSFVDLPGVRHGFLARDLPSYDLAAAERAWSAIVAFLKQQLTPPPPKLPSIPPRPAGTPPPPIPPERSPASPVAAGVPAPARNPA